METTLVVEKPIQKIYTVREIWFGTFFGGPLAAGYLIAENFKAFNENDKAKKTWIYAIIVTVIIFGILFLIPENENFPDQIFPFIYTGIAFYITKNFQELNITAHLNSGGLHFSWWRTTAVGIIGLVITIILIIGFVLVTDASSNVGMETKTYGKMKHEILFDKKNISEIEVNKIAEGFVKTTFFDETVTKYVYATKTNNNYELSISVVPGAENENQAMQEFIDLRTEMQQLFPQNKIIFKLVVDDLDNVVKRIE